MIFHHSVEGWCVWVFYCCLEVVGDSWGVAAAEAGVVTPAQYLTPYACVNKVSGTVVWNALISTWLSLFYCSYTCFTWGEKNLTSTASESISLLPPLNCY